MRMNWLRTRGDSRKNEEERGGWRGWGPPPLPLLTLLIESAIKWPIMDGFQILRCLWKRLNKTLQTIILEFSKPASLVTKNVTKENFWDFFFSSIHASLKFIYSLCFLTYMKMVDSTWFYGLGTTTFAHKDFISKTFVTQSFDFKMTYFRRRHSRQKLLLFRCKWLNKTQY